MEIHLVAEHIKLAASRGEREAQGDLLDKPFAFGD